MCNLDALSTRFGKLFLRMHRLMDRRMSSKGMSLSRTKLLLYLDREGAARAADLADYFQLAPRTVTEAIDGLERDGFLRRDPDPDDRRVKRITITESGRATIAATEPIRLELVDQIFGVLDDAERAQLSGVLDKLASAVERQELGLAQQVSARA
jgi:DNA-binding MarR family transcriptional regulator